MMTRSLRVATLGIALLIPPLRQRIKRGIVTWLQRNVELRTASFTGSPGPAGEWRSTYSSSSSSPPPGRAEIIDAHIIDTRVEDVS